MAALLPYTEKGIVAERLPIIFPEGTPNRNYCVRELAVSTVFTLLYIGAVEGSGRYLGPVHVYRMTDKQALKRSDADRSAYCKAVVGKRKKIAGKRWYADNTREPIRDETLRGGLVAIGAVSARDDIPTTSGVPRYALKREFAALFSPVLQGAALADAIADFQKNSLSKSALARVAIVRSGVIASDNGTLVRFPSGETRKLSPGPSSAICQSIVEVFSGKFLTKPVVLWLSESGNKVVVRDDKLASSIGLKIEADKNLPDLILVDLGPSSPLIIFVEIVATDGAITPQRQESLYRITDAAGFGRHQIAFVTAYQDRSTAGFKKTVSHLAWNSFAWFASEPENLVHLRDGEQGLARITEILSSSP